MFTSVAQRDKARIDARRLPLTWPGMQDDLFGGAPAPIAPLAPAAPAGQTPGAQAAAPPEHAPRRRAAGAVAPAEFDETRKALGAALPPLAHLGTSSWSYPGWQGLVWDGSPSAQQLSRQGLAVYAQHPLFRTVSIDRGFYRPLTVSEYERYASQVPDDFRFVVKAPSLVPDALVRSEDGRGRQANAAFLSPELACSEFVEPALQGLGHKTGALVFQLSPLPLAQLDRMHEVLDRLHAMLAAQPRVSDRAPAGVVAVEVRDPEWLTPDFAAVLRDKGCGRFRSRIKYGDVETRFQQVRRHRIAHVADADESDFFDCRHCSSFYQTAPRAVIGHSASTRPRRIPTYQSCRLIVGSQ